MISIIAAVGKNLELGKKNSLIWHVPEDMKFFKSTTTNHTVIVGLNTFKSFPNGLPNRKMIVLTDEKLDNKEKNIETTTDVDDLVKKYGNSDEEVFIIGGAYVYSVFIKYAKTIYLTEIEDTDKEADTYFPNFNKLEWNKEILKECTQENLKFSIIKYTKKSV